MRESELAASIGKIVRIYGNDGDWEAVLKRRSPDNGHWEVTNPNGKLVAVTAQQILGLKGSVEETTNVDSEPIVVEAGEMPDKSWDLPDLATFILGSLRRTVVDAWWIGEALDIARTKHREERNWLKWLEIDVQGLSKSTAYRYMALCTAFTLDEVEGKPLSVLYKLMEGQREDNDDEDEDHDGGAEPENAGDDNTALEGQDDMGDDSVTDDLPDDADQQEPVIAGKIHGRTSSAAGKQDGDHETDDETKAPDEPQPPITAAEIDALTTFIELVGGMTRAVYVLKQGIEQLRELKNED